jgi:hypothetical protein
MKLNHLLVIGTLCALIGILPSCEKAVDERMSNDLTPIFKAGFDDASETKTYTDAELKLYWNASDEISVFASNSINKKYTFQGANGDKKGTFTTSDSQTGTATLSANYALYPYNSQNSISSQGTISFSLPTSQHYVAGTFEKGIFPMVAVTSAVDDDYFSFRNVCGILAVKLTGSFAVKSLTLTGNNNEYIAGDIKVTPSYNKIPSIATASTSSKSVTLDCGDGVQLNATTPTEFWFVIAPTAFTKGFSVTVNDGKSYMTKSTSQSISVDRNKVMHMAAFGYVPQPYLTLSTDSFASPSAATSSSPIDISSNVSWTIASDQDWCTVSKASGTGDDSFIITVTKNPTISTRTATITVATTDKTISKTLTVTQSVGDPTLSVSPESYSAAYTASTSDAIAITSNSPWSITSSQSWCTVSKSSGSGNGTFTISVTQNTVMESRSAVITITTSDGTLTHTVNVTQAASPATLTISSDSYAPTYEAATSGAYSIASNTSWTIASDQTWCTVSKSSGTNDDTFTISVEVNPNADIRTATITIKTADNTVTRTITVTQGEGPATLTLNPVTFKPTSEASTQVVTVTSNATWEAACDSTWCTITPNKGTGNGTFTISVKANSETTSRSTTITVTAVGKTASNKAVQTISVKQQGTQIEDPGDGGEHDW